MKKNQIIRIYGTDYLSMTEKLLAFTDMKSDILEKTGKRPEEAVIGIKPNLVTPVPADFGATTHPELIEGLIRYLREAGFEKIMIAEGSWVGDSTQEAFEYCGFRRLEEKYGVRLIDTKKEKSRTVFCGKMELNICDTVFGFDYLINVPVLKGHCQTKMTCALKNMKGLIPDREKRRFHQMGLHEPIACLNAGIHQDFILVDDICGDPDFEEGGNPDFRNCIFAAKDPVLADTFACRELGWKKEDVPYVCIAESLGVGSSENGEEILLNRPDFQKKPAGRRRILDVSVNVEESDTCSACFSALNDALWRLEQEGLRPDPVERIGIGQGMQGKPGRLGIGNCTSCFERFVKGCPPESGDIYRFLKENACRG